MLKKFDLQSLAFSFLSDFVLIYPFYNLMFKQSGIGQFGMSFLLIIMQGTKMLTDLPSGLIADRYGRKTLLFLAQILRAGFMVLWALKPSYPSFAIGMVLWGMSMSCIYGNVEAYVYDELKGNNRANDFPRFMSRYYTIQNVAIAIATGMSHYFFTLGSYPLILLISAGVVMLSGFVCLQLPDHQFEKSIVNDEEIEEKITLLNAIKIFVNNSAIRFYAVLAAINDGVFVFFIDLNTTLMAHGEFKADIISKVVTFMAFSRIITNFIAGYTAAWFSPIMILGCMLAFFTQIKLATCFYSVNAAIIGIIGYLIFYALIDLAIKTKIQAFISSHFRATIMSMASFLMSIFAIFLNTLNGGMTSIFYTTCNSYNQASLDAAGIVMLFLIAVVLATLCHYFKIRKDYAGTAGS